MWSTRGLVLLNVGRDLDLHQKPRIVLVLFTFSVLPMLEGLCVLRHYYFIYNLDKKCLFLLSQVYFIVDLNEIVNLTI